MAQLIENVDQKFAHSGRFEVSFMTILRVKKVVFSTFSKLYQIRLGNFYTLILNLKGLLFGLFLARLINDQKSRDFQSNWSGSLLRFLMLVDPLHTPCSKFQ